MKQHILFVNPNCLQQLIANISRAYLILAGDWNVVLNDTLDDDRSPSHENKNLKGKGKFCQFFSI